METTTNPSINLAPGSLAATWFARETQLPTPQALLAATTADDVFKSMGDSLDSDINPLHLAAVVGGVILLVALIALISNRVQRRPSGKTSSANVTKLNRQLAKAAGLKAREVKQLRLLAAQEKIDNPLVLLLCPSVLKLAASKRQAARVG